MAMECHANVMTDSIAGILRLIEGVKPGALRVYYQPYNWEGADSPEKLAEEIGPYVACVHAQNFDAGYQRAFIEEGIVDYSRIVPILKDKGFDGYLAVEFTAGEGSIEDLQRDYETLKRLVT
jgi:sugar phosphate isomerase/epimerase